ncbi:MAG: protein kinase [Myxococcota bacterium]|nr:protein kinase [Deltaproteobacteria bacterium]MDQ3334583.1 protein kinase [Myxococcota bacterium]
MSEQNDEPIFTDGEIDPWIDALDTVLKAHEAPQASSLESPHESRVRARGTTPPPGIPTEVTAEPAASEPTPRIEAGAYVTRTRAWAFVLDEAGHAVELGSGRFAKAFLGEERWLQSKTSFTRPVAIKCLQRGVTGIDLERFQIEKTILEQVQGHPNIVELMGSGEGGTPGCSDAFIPPSLRGKLENDFMILELLDCSLEDLLRGARNKRRRDDLLALPNPERLFRVLDYVLPVATAIEFAHLERDVCHRDIKPANIVVKLPDSSLRGSQLKVKLADFNVGSIASRDERLHSVPGTLYFQSPEQATNTFEVLCNCTRGSAEVQLFEDFYIDISRNDGFSLFNHAEQYQVIAADRARKRILLDRPYAERDETQVRGQIIKAVGRPADVYSLGALLYYLISGATNNPKALFDGFKRFGEYERQEDTNSVGAYLDHEYKTIASLRAPKPDHPGIPEVAFEDRFFSYKQFLDGSGELIEQQVMLVIAKAMIRNKPDSYCFADDLRSTGVSAFIHDLLALYIAYGVDPHARYARTTDYHPPRKSGPMRRAFDRLFSRSD